MDDVRIEEKKKQFVITVKEHVKLSCRQCHGRGFILRSFPANARLGINQTAEWKEYCSCVKNNMGRVKRDEKKERVEVFEVGKRRNWR